MSDEIILFFAVVITGFITELSYKK
ncbi:hypothetical protein ACFL60_05450 [Candidatus Omnitrophota bacterium]